MNNPAKLVEISAEGFPLGANALSQILQDEQIYHELLDQNAYKDKRGRVRLMVYEHDAARVYQMIHEHHLGPVQAKKLSGILSEPYECDECGSTNVEVSGPGFLKNLFSALLLGSRGPDRKSCECRQCGHEWSSF